MRLFTMVIFSAAFLQSAAAANLNNYQWIGSHNSYKKGLPESVYQFLAQRDQNAATQIDYGHISIEKQLDSGLRQLEIDVVNDISGNQYDSPELAGRLKESWFTDDEKQQLVRPGFKVLHIPHVDVQSYCIDFANCLIGLRSWSDAHPDHFPVVVMMNAKENQPSFIESPAPALFTAATYDQLNDVIRKEMAKKLITPDDIRGDFSTLREAVLNDGWPDADALRGKFIFLFDGNAIQNERFMRGHAGLVGRAMFTSLPKGDAGAAIMIINDPLKQQQDIRQLVSQGFLVRTRADADLSASIEQKARQRDAAFSSGAQMISTDFYPGSPQAERDEYSVSFADGALIRPNPVTH